MQKRTLKLFQVFFLLATVSFGIAGSFGFPGIANAESGGTILGKVFYRNEMPVVCEKLPCERSKSIPVVGKLVLVRGKLGGGRTFTNHEGKFSVERLPQGRYTVTVRGFDRKRVDLQRGKKIATVSVFKVIY